MATIPALHWTGLGCFGNIASLRWPALATRAKAHNDETLERLG